ncbi:hypothetical protein JKP88DRAFT_277126 [Tribonema minus]|uniref:Uncharacterized protein n=1 Tax=Tribonema minus TaxID=303371 RepID=A0A835Z8Q6_9STRA|nr:hypothetical protein JKP88DRAFT_277126 [Tribonema minus]
MSDQEPAGPYLTVVAALWVICMLFSCLTAVLYTQPGNTSAAAAAAAAAPPPPHATAAPTTEGESSAQQMLGALLSGQSDVYTAFVALLAASNSAYVGMYSMLCTTEVAHKAEQLGPDKAGTPAGMRKQGAKGHTMEVVPQGQIQKQAMLA